MSLCIGLVARTIDQHSEWAHYWAHYERKKKRLGGASSFAALPSLPFFARSIFCRASIIKTLEQAMSRWSPGITYGTISHHNIKVNQQQFPQL